MKTRHVPRDCAQIRVDFRQSICRQFYCSVDQSNFTISYQYVYCRPSLSKTFSNNLTITVGDSSEIYTWYDGMSVPANASDYGGASFSRESDSNMFTCNATTGSNYAGSDESKIINSYNVSYEYSSKVDRNESILVQISNYLDNHNYWFMIGNVEIECEGL